MATLRKLVLGLFVALLLLAACEGLLRVFVPADALLFNFERPDGYLVFAQAESGHLVGTDVPPDWLKVRPDLTWTECTSAGALRFRTEGHGFREEADVPRQKAPGTTRYLALGDSWIFGIGQSQEETIVRLVEDRLGAPGSLQDGTGLDIVNAGVPGSTGFDMLRRWRSLADSFEIDGLILGRPHNDRPDAEGRAFRARWYQDMRGAPAYDLRLYLALRRAIVPMTRSPYRALSADEYGQGWKNGLDDVLTIVREARGRGLDVHFLLFPDPHGFRDDELRAALADGGLPAGLDAWPPALAELGATVTGHAQFEGACWSADDSTHPGLSGARVFAELLSETIATGSSPGVMAAAPACQPAPDHQREPCRGVGTRQAAP